MQLTLFFIFAGLAVAGAINLLIQRHPIYSALSLVTVMFALAVEYLILGAEFIAFIQIIVYAGAIMVLFLFVVMLLNAPHEETEYDEHTQMVQRSGAMRFGGFLAVVLAMELV
ncbi:MAG: NADH-quinone oxidoreductase subunit J family protein, partial [Terriglobales bacterium]